MENDTFYASKILMKCPSKYNNNMVEVEANGQVKEYKKS
jgi:cytochrome c-type biogenesis protein CcmE